METIQNGGRIKRPPSILYRLTSLFLGILLLMSFAFIVLPAIKNHTAIGPYVEKIKNSGIEAGAFWYTDVEKVGKAVNYIHDAMNTEVGIQNTGNEKK